MRNTGRESVASRPQRLKQDSLLAAAKSYLELGWNVIPLVGKRPAIRWKPFQVEKATTRDAEDWFGGLKPQFTGIGIVTGKVSGLAVVDCDSPEATQFWTSNFPRAGAVVETGRGGTHHYYALPADVELRNRAKIDGHEIDLRGNGGYIVAPPSIHPNGRRYRWLCDPVADSSSLSAIDPAWFAPRPTENGASLANHRFPTRAAAAYIAKIHAVSGKGGHNATFRAACVLRDFGLSSDEALAELTRWNETNATPPWSLSELTHKVDDAFSR